MHSVQFYKLSPSGNMTVLFDGLEYSAKEREFYASKALSSCHIAGEQAGFVDIEQGILQMAGGEFCINATRSLALLMALDQARKKSKAQSVHYEGMVKCSGFEQYLSAQVCEVNEGVYNVSIGVPFLDMPPIYELDKNIYLVQLSGISHVIIDEKHMPFCPDSWEQSSAEIRQKYNLEKESAVGCIWWHADGQEQHEGQVSLCMHPIVRIKNPWALHYENACGSGALALGLWHYKHYKQSSFIMHQPGGYLTLQLQQDIQELKAIVGGPVSLVAKGKAFFEIQK